MTDGRDSSLGDGSQEAVTFEDAEEMAVLTFDAPWAGDFAADLSDVLFDLLVRHNPEPFTDEVVEKPRRAACTHLDVTVTVHEDGRAQVILPARYTA